MKTVYAFPQLDASLRENLNLNLRRGLDAELITGDEGLLNGTKLSNNNVSAETDFRLVSVSICILQAGY